MFASNFPVGKGTCSYQVLWNTFKHIAAGYSATRRPRSSAAPQQRRIT